MRYLWFLGLTGITVLSVLGNEISPAVQEVKTLQGEWMVVGIEGGGYKASADELKGMKWSIQDTTISASQPGASGKMRFSLNPKKTPKEFDITSLEGSFKGQTDPGIYELENGRLRICYRDPDNTKGARPKSFNAAAAPNSGYGIIILQKMTN